MKMASIQLKEVARWGALGVLALACPVDAALTATVIGTTATQAILTYTAPDANVCTVDVSENASYTPPVHDVDPALFTGANQDNRAGSLTGNLTRVVVIGKRAAERSPDGRYYSRALQAHTLHYYRVTCGASSAAGTFTTTNIPIGNTWGDPLPVDPGVPGNFAWPSLPTQRSESVIDPQTGLLIKPMMVPSDHVTMSFGAGGESHEFCSHTQVANENGEMGFHCIIPGSVAELYWINSTTGETRMLGAISPYPGSGLFDAIDANNFYGWGWVSGRPAIQRWIYHGQNIAVVQPTQQLPDCASAAAPCIEKQWLTSTLPGRDIATQVRQFAMAADPGLLPWMLDMAYEPSFSEISSVQNGQIVLTRLMGNQNSMGWTAVYDVGNGLSQDAGGTGSVVAAMSTFRNAPVRWCGIHGTAQSGESHWSGVIVDPLLGAGEPVKGGGPYEVHLAQAVPTTLNACPANSFGVSGNQCSTLVVTGEPCNPARYGNELTNPAKCANPTDGYLQDAQEGDYFSQAATAAGWDVIETVRLLVKNGNTWTVQRALWNTLVRPMPAGTLLHAECSVPIHTYYWDYLNDPHGTNAGGATVVLDANSDGAHATYHGNLSVEAAYAVRTGPLPDFTQSVSQAINPTPSFAGAIGDNMFGMQSYPGVPVESNAQWFLDSRAVQGGNGSYPTATVVGGQLYKYTSTAYGGHGALSLHPQQRQVAAFTNDHVLTDVSGPNSSIATHAGSAYTFCIAKKAGECRSGSAVGDVYANAPNVQTLTCIYPGWNGQPWQGINDLCVGDAGFSGDKITQIGVGVLPNAAGSQGRALTGAFLHYRHELTYWTVNGLPDGSWLMFNMPPDATYGDWAGQGYIAKLPPFPAADGVARNDFLSIPITIAAPPGISVNNAVIEFGYAENGLPANFYCTSRHEACVKGSQAGTSYGFTSDNPAGVACASGCTIRIPAVPQRLVYFQVKYRDAANTVLKVDGPHVVAAEPPYLVSDAGLVSTPPLPTAALTASTLNGDTPFTVQFDGTASHGNPAPIVYTLMDFGDGAFATGNQVAHTYTNGGTYTAKITIRDSNGQSGEATVQIHVTGSAAGAGSAAFVPHIYPNPWRSNKHARIPMTFANLPSQSTIELFTVSGHKIKELHVDNASADWDLTNASGEKVGSGLYLYVITAPHGHPVKGTVAVIR